MTVLLIGSTGTLSTGNPPTGMMSLPSSTVRLSAVTTATRQLEAMMTSSIDSLVNQLVPLKATGNVASAGTQAAVIEAVVLANSPLLASKSNPGLNPGSSPVLNSGENAPQIKVTLGNNQQHYELITRIPIPVGAKVQLKIAPNNLAVLLSINNSTVDAAAQAGRSAFGRAVAPDNTALLTNRLTIANPTQLYGDKPGSGVISTLDTAQPSRQLIEQTLRQVLPQQQALRTLLPLLQAVTQQPQVLPRDLIISLSHLLKQFPTSEQLQHPQPLKRAVLDSGIFFESKLARQTLVANKHAANKPENTTGTRANPNTPINRDIKGLMQRLVSQLDRTAPPKASGDKPSAVTATSSATTPLTNDATQRPDPALYSPQVPMQNHRPTVSKADHASDQSLDVLLRQLGRQLLATLARTQLNQLETLSHRHQPATDNQTPINSWHLEIPILHGQHVDNLRLQIEERLAEQHGEQRAAQNKQWMVMLNFDLHQLGKMQVQLTIVEKQQTQVSATVWSQLRETHLQVQQHLQELKTGLEAAGIVVKQVDCQIGLPPGSRLPLYQQLVDVRT